jgi:hypothetical protein
VLAAAGRAGAEVVTEEDTFRARPSGLAGLLGEVAGEVGGRVEGSLLEGYAGIRRLGFTIIAAAVAAALFWELAALLALIIGSAEQLQTHITWQPLAGALVLLGVGSLGLGLLLQAERSALDLLDAMTTALPPPQPLAPAAPAAGSEPDAATPPPAGTPRSRAPRRASSAAPARVRSRRSRPASPPD